MKLVFPLLLVAAAQHGTNAELDLYVREKFVTVNGEPCGECTEGGDSGCFLSTRNFYLQNSCFNRNYRRSSIYAEVEEGLVCRQELGDSCESEEGVAFTAESVDDCRDSWQLHTCTDSEHMKKLSSWCTVTDGEGPVGEYTVPLITFKEYEGTSCGSSDYSHLLLPDEGGSCVPLSFQSSDGTWVTGSREVSCDGGAFRALRYDSPDCTSDALVTTFDGSYGECPDNDEETVYTNDCAAPNIYCKSLSFSESVGNGKGSIAVSTKDNGGTGTAAPAGLLVMSMAILFLSWVA